jgi:hypothetical protein
MEERTSQMTIADAKAHQPVLHNPTHAHTHVHGAHWFGRINKKIAVTITNAVGSMWAAYLFCALALVSLPAAIHSHDPIIIVAWIAQTFLQLVLLPIIIVAQNVQAAAADARAKSDHATLKAIHTLTREVYDINQRQNEILQLLRDTTIPRTTPAELGRTGDDDA